MSNLSISKPVLGLLLGSVLGLLDGLSGFLYPGLVGQMTTVILWSTGKGVASGLIIGVVARHLRSMTLGILAGLGVGAAFSLLVVVITSAEKLLWDIVLPGMLLGVIVGFATQKFGRAEASTSQVPSPSVRN